MMRTLALVGMILVLAGCTTLDTVDGFDAAAAQGQVVRIEGVGWGRSGRFAITPIGATGTFERSARSASQNGDRLDDGTLRFTLTGGEFDGFSGECANSRASFEVSEQVSRRARMTTSFLTGPYLITCGFFRGADPVGRMRLQEQAGADFRALRSGRAELGAARASLSSIHKAPGLVLESGDPLAYAMDYGDGREAIVFANGADRRIALPDAGRDQRAVALLTGIALALAWEPDDDG